MSRSFLALLLALAAALSMAACAPDTPPLGPATLPATETAKVHTDTFKLKAYDLDSVHLAGSLNSWADQDPAWELTVQPDSTTWLLVKEVPDVIHTYKYVIR